MNLRSEFSSPSSTYRGKPFWAWNGKLEKAELLRQLGVLKDMGMGGVFMHARVGLETPYLSKEWFDLIRACAEESKRLGIEAWLYDEDRWPSGAAGGLVTKNKAYSQRLLTMEIVAPKKFKRTRDILALFVASVDGNAATNVRRVMPKEPLKASSGERVLVFRAKIASETPWFNNQTYVDTLSQKAMAQFIKVTHDAYAKNAGAYFGRTIPGIFTDEPNYGRECGLRDNAGAAPWTDALPSVFRKRCKYDLLGHLPALFFRIDGEDFSKARRDYYDCLTHLFTRNFGKQIYDWCGKHGIDFTGHLLDEETLRLQADAVGGAMRFYEYMQAPGIDILCAQILSRPGGREPELLTAKQCSSMLRQFGRRWMLSELYGCTGWHFTFAEHKAVGDWQAALGVNLRCHHLSWYTMLGEAKRDYPASISFQSPWWRDYKVVEDYFARTTVLMMQGEPVRDVAVIHPIESQWGINYAGVGEPADILQKQLSLVERTLLEQHIDFDYVDEDVLERHGRVSQGGLRVARAAYRAIVVPPMQTMRSSTLKTLASFMRAGGQVVFVQPVPMRIDAVNNDAACGLAGQARVVPSSKQALIEVLNDLPGVRRISVTSESGAEYTHCLYMLREDARTGVQYLFICHTLQDKDSGPLTVTAPARGQAQEWDAATGEVFTAEARQARGGIAVATSLPPCGSRLFVFDPKADRKLAHRPALGETRAEPVERERWSIMRDEPNAFPLDTAAYALKGGAWRGPLEILRLDNDVRRSLGMPPRGGRMAQPWSVPVDPKAKTAPLALRYRFEVETLPAGPCHLVIERPETFDITLNGIPLRADEDEGWWIDTSFRKIRVLPWFFTQGPNELVLTTNYGPASGLEALYLTGEFGFKWNGTTPVMTAAPASLALGDWVPQGLACYTGAVTYCTEFAPSSAQGERVFVTLPGWQGVLARIRVNGVQCGCLAWAPFEADVTDALTPGANKLEIEIVSSRRNLLGPLHLTEKYPVWTGPGQFRSDGEQWTDEYVALPYGLMAAPVLSYRAGK
ncbi:hypothetical protein GX586_07210 [bacterium]|nr:hypothetical protein [bacterium]